MTLITAEEKFKQMGLAYCIVLPPLTKKVPSSESIIKKAEDSGGLLVGDISEESKLKDYQYLLLIEGIQKLCSYQQLRDLLEELRKKKEGLERQKKEEGV